MSARLLIADDHGVVRNGLREILRVRPDLRIVAEAGNGNEALYLAKQGNIDLVVLDISLPGCSGIKVLEDLRAAGATVPVLFFSMHPAEQYAAYLLQAKAQGFLNKNAGGAELLSAIDRILVGDVYFPTLLRRSKHPLPPAAVDMNSLSARETMVMLGIVSGKSQIEIAAELGITNKSVGTYRLRLLGKLGISSNAGLIALAARLGIVG